jgi:Flp pilus assembly protein TadG
MAPLAPRASIRTRGDRGTAIVELALLLPFLAVLVCGTIDAGRWFSAWNETKNAAREGALYAQSYPLQQRPAAGRCAAPNNIEDRARQELSSNGTDTSFTVTISPAVTGCAVPASPGASAIPPGTTITVRVTRRMVIFTPIVSGLMGTVDISAQVKAVVQG